MPVPVSLNLVRERRSLGGVSPKLARDGRSLGAGMLSPLAPGPTYRPRHPSMVSQYLVYSIRIVVNAIVVWCGLSWRHDRIRMIGPVDQPGGEQHAGHGPSTPSPQPLSLPERRRLGVLT